MDKNENCYKKILTRILCIIVSIFIITGVVYAVILNHYMDLNNTTDSRQTAQTTESVKP